METLEDRRLLSVAPLLVDVRAISVTGGVITDAKHVALKEGGTVKLGIYLRNINGTSVANFGLADYSVSLRSGNGAKSGVGHESMDYGLTWPVAPSPTDTVAQPVGSTSNAKMLGAGFDVGVSGGKFTALDAGGTDLDVKGLGGAQVPGGVPDTIGIGINSEVLLGTVNYKALTLSHGTRPLQRSVDINTFFTSSGGGYGGLYVTGLSSNDPSSDYTPNLATLASVGTAVTLTVTATGAAPVNPIAATPQATAITAKTTNWKKVTMTYTDRAVTGLLKAAMIDNADVRVKGPNGYSVVGKVATKPSANGKTLTAVYQVPPPNGVWDSRANGTYSIYFLSKAIGDTAGRLSASTQYVVGSFTVNVPAVQASALVIIPAAGSPATSPFKAAQPILGSEADPLA